MYICTWRSTHRLWLKATVRACVKRWSVSETLAHMTTAAITSPLALDAVTDITCFQTEFLQNHGLPSDCSLPFRVYVLRCRQALILTAGFVYYVGIIPASEIVDRIQKHKTGNGARFTRANVPVAVELRWPALRRAAEAYIYAYLLELLPAGAVCLHGRLGGWTQCHPKPLPVVIQSEVQRQWRMVRDRSLECGEEGHFCRTPACRLSDQSSQPQSSQGQSTVALASTSASYSGAHQTATSSAQQLPLAPTRSALIGIAPEPNPSLVVRSAGDHVAPDWDALFETWFGAARPQPLETDWEGWVALTSVLKALGEGQKNPRRYLEQSDCPAKIWKLGPRGRMPRENLDWKTKAAPGNKKLLVRKTFLKDVLVRYYPQKLT